MKVSPNLPKCIPLQIVFPFSPNQLKFHLKNSLVVLHNQQSRQRVSEFHRNLCRLYFLHKAYIHHFQITSENGIKPTFQQQ